MAEHPIVAMERFRLTAENAAETEEVLAIFYSLTQDKLALLTPGTSTKTWCSVVHYIKGSAANLGMEALAETCRRCEITPPGTPEERARALEMIRHEFVRVQQYFAELRL